MMHVVFSFYEIPKIGFGVFLERPIIYALTTQQKITSRITIAFQRCTANCVQDNKKKSFKNYFYLNNKKKIFFTYSYLTRSLRVFISYYSFSDQNQR